mgnify:CR=1 FL=1
MMVYRLPRTRRDVQISPPPRDAAAPSAVSAPPGRGGGGPSGLQQAADSAADAMLIAIDALEQLAAMVDHEDPAVARIAAGVAAVHRQQVPLVRGIAGRAGDSDE